MESRNNNLWLVNEEAHSELKNKTTRKAQISYLKMEISAH